MLTPGTRHNDYRRGHARRIQESDPMEATASISGLHRLPTWVVPVATIIVWFVIALMVYRPFTPFAFDVNDFPEFLPMLRQGDSFGERLTDVTRYFATRGRASVATYALLVLNYELWGENTVGWQVTRVFQLTAAGVLLFVLLRRWGSSALGAAVAALLVTCARSAAPNCHRLVAYESLGLVVMLTAFLIATGFRASSRPVLRTMALSVIVAFMILLKEVWVAVLPAIWAVALLTGERG